MKARPVSVGTVAVLLASSLLALGQMSADNLDQLLGPIALYPDPLIAQLLPASTLPGQITIADQALQGGLDPGQVDAQPWDNSVKAVAHYPAVLKWMDDNMAWTTALGQVFAAQPDDVMASIQRLRGKAQSLGNLASNPQEQVADDGGNIEIVPSDPNSIYVPSYQPQEVYAEPPPPDGSWISFGVGFPIGLWLDSDFDWRARHIFAWPHDHFRPGDWWHEPPGRRPRPPGGEHGVTVWRPREVPVRTDRGYPENARRTAYVPRPAEAPGRVARPVESPRPVQRSVEGPRPVQRPVESPRPVQRPVQRPAAPPPRAYTAPPARGALVGVGSARETRSSSARGQASRAAAPSSGGRKR